jgi:hypothetical protein
MAPALDQGPGWRQRQKLHEIDLMGIAVEREVRSQFEEAERQSQPRAVAGVRHFAPGRFVVKTCLRARAAQPSNNTNGAPW